MQQTVGNLYDDLAGFESMLGQGKRKNSYSIHKRLFFERSEATQHLQDINEWILEKLPINKDGRVLDAGCGVGHTLLTFCQQSQMTGLGISLSAKEVGKAQASASHLQLSNSCQFIQQSFDQPFDQKFDTIIAIESLKHAPNLKRALNNLAAALTENGCLIIVEDFGQAHWQEELELQVDFLKHWSVQKFYTRKDYTDTLLPILGSVRQEVYDFTPFMESKSANKMLSKYHWLRRLRPLVLFPFFKSILSTFAGGFLLDYFYAKNWVKYQLLFLQKQPK
jgi:2-polyprenyl-3-methyl-5-hydroxy-6-metoxy-1,4-benzoquinol methylase